jgi:hypothetical protein
MKISFALSLLDGPAKPPSHCKIRGFSRFFAVVFLVAASGSDTLGQSVIDLIASSDNTLFEAAAGGISNGSGQFLFAGRTNSAEIRRGLIRFDLSQLASAGSGIRIDSAIVTLHMSKSVAGSMDVGLHKMQASWGEGSSDAPGEEGAGTNAATGDATWTHRMHATTTWQTAGGDFESESLASQSVAGVGFYRWKSSSLTASVQEWLDNPLSNFGLAIIGNEQGASRTTKRFDSRESSVALNRPVMKVYYSVGVGVEKDGQVPLHDLSVAVFPNPASRSENITLNFDSPAAGPLYVSAFDLLGRRVHSYVFESESSGSNFASLSLDGLSSGRYILLVEQEGLRKTVMVALK